MGDYSKQQQQHLHLPGGIGTPFSSTSIRSSHYFPSDVVSLECNSNLDKGISQMHDGFEIGDRVFCLSASKERASPCIIVNRTKDNRNFHVLFDNGSEYYPVPRESLTLAYSEEPVTDVQISMNPHPTTAVASTGQKHVGDIIEVTIVIDLCLEKFPAVIEKVNRDGTYNVRYEDGTVDFYIDESCGKVVNEDASPGRVGEIVEVVQVLGMKFQRFSAKILSVNDDGSYCVEYSDGSITSSVPQRAVYFSERCTKFSSSHNLSPDSLSTYNFNALNTSTSRPAAPISSPFIR
jgi:hypothetical protein